MGQRWCRKLLDTKNKWFPQAKSFEIWEICSANVHHWKFRNNSLSPGGSTPNPKNPKNPKSWPQLRRPPKIINHNHCQVYPEILVFCVLVVWGVLSNVFKIDKICNSGATWALEMPQITKMLSHTRYVALENKTSVRFGVRRWASAGARKPPDAKIKWFP